MFNSYLFISAFILILQIAIPNVYIAQRLFFINIKRMFQNKEVEIYIRDNYDMTCYWSLLLFQDIILKGCDCRFKNFIC